MISLYNDSMNRLAMKANSNVLNYQIEQGIELSYRTILARKVLACSPANALEEVRYNPVFNSNYPFHSTSDLQAASASASAFISITGIGILAVKN